MQFPNLTTTDLYQLREKLPHSITIMQICGAEVMKNESKLKYQRQDMISRSSFDFLLTYANIFLGQSCVAWIACDKETKTNMFFLNSCFANCS